MSKRIMFAITASILLAGRVCANQPETYEEAIAIKHGKVAHAKAALDTAIAEHENKLDSIVGNGELTTSWWLCALMHAEMKRQKEDLDALLIFQSQGLPAEQAIDLMRIWEHERLYLLPKDVAPNYSLDPILGAQSA